MYYTCEFTLIKITNNHFIFKNYTYYITLKYILFTAIL